MTRIFALLGPTASGKSEIALELAAAHDLPIVSVDSMQVYRGLDIGTAKPTADERARVRHFMLDVVEPEQEYSVAEFQATARELIATESAVLIVGGSGLHFRSIVDPLEFPPTDSQLRAELETIPDPARELVGVDPTAGSVVDLSNPRRVVRALEILRLTGLTPTDRARQENRRAFDEYRPWLQFSAVGVDPGPDLVDRIRMRVKAMKGAGWWEEVEALRGRLGRTAAGAVGYLQLSEAQAGLRAHDDVWEDVIAATRGLARRQRTYFRRDPRIRWIPWSPEPAARMKAVSEALSL